jgi:hypothetical protein
VTIVRSLRLGPALFVLLGLLCAALGYWLPLRLDRQYGPEVDSGIWFVAVGFSPVTAASAALALFGYFRLSVIQRKDSSIKGLVLLILLFPLLGASVATGILLAPATIILLPFLVDSMFVELGDGGAGLVFSVFGFALWWRKRKARRKRGDQRQFFNS